MITGFFDDGYGLGMQTKIVLKAKAPAVKPVFKLKSYTQQYVMIKPDKPRVDGDYIIMNSKGITPWDLI